MRSTALRCPTRRTGRGEAKCAELRARAAELFLARGFDGVSLDEIVRAAGGSKTNVYGFFGGKEGLFRAVVEAGCDELLAPLHRLDLDGATLREGLTQIGRTLLDLLLKPCHLGLYRLVMGEGARFPALGASWYARGPAVSHAVISGFLARHLARRPGTEVAGGLPPQEAAVLFHDLVVGDLVTRALAGEPPADAEARDAAVRRAVRMVAG